MSGLVINKGVYTPEVELREGFISIEGNSYPSNTKKFYKPIIDWLKDYIKTSPEYTEVHLKFEHMDSPTVKSVYELIKILYTAEKENASKTEVFWYYELEDEETLDKGKLISEHLKMNFNFIRY